MILLQFLNNQFSPEIELTFEVMNLVPSLAFRGYFAIFFSS